MKIVQIISQDKSVLGLGDDGKLYRFDPQTRQWVLWEVESA